MSPQYPMQRCNSLDLFQNRQCPPRNLLPSCLALTVFFSRPKSRVCVCKEDPQRSRSSPPQRPPPPTCPFPVVDDISGISPRLFSHWIYRILLFSTCFFNGADSVPRFLFQIFLAGACTTVGGGRRCCTATLCACYSDIFVVQMQAALQRSWSCL